MLRGIESNRIESENIIQIWHLGECNINFYCTQKNDIARGACAECNIIFQSAIKIDIVTKPKCHICFIICLLLIQIKYLTNLKNYAPQYQFCKVVMWPWSDQSQQRMSSRHIINQLIESIKFHINDITSIKYRYQSLLVTLFFTRLDLICESITSMHIVCPMGKGCTLFIQMVETIITELIILMTKIF